jgi:hypothetical protein
LVRDHHQVSTSDAENMPKLCVHLDQLVPCKYGGCLSCNERKTRARLQPQEIHPPCLLQFVAGGTSSSSSPIS